MENLKITQGEWVVAPDGITVKVNGKTIGTAPRIYVATEEAEANAKLIAEAGTVANECGLTPRQLLEQRNEMLKTLNNVLAEIAPAYNFDLRNSEGVIKEAYLLTQKPQNTPQELERDFDDGTY